MNRLLMLLMFSGCCSVASAQDAIVITDRPIESRKEVIPSAPSNPASVDDQSTLPIAAAVPVADSPLAGSHVVVFTKRNCQPCLQVATTTTPQLKAAGIPVTVIDVDRDSIDPSWGITLAPTLWIVDSKTRKPRVKFQPGYVSAWTVMQASKAWKSKQVTVKAIEKAKPRYDIYNGGPNSSHENRGSLINHLLNEGIQAGRRTVEELEAMTDQELDDLHTEDHRANGQVRVVRTRQQTTVRRGPLGFFRWSR